MSVIVDDTSGAVRFIRLRMLHVGTSPESCLMGGSDAWRRDLPTRWAAARYSRALAAAIRGGLVSAIGEDTGNGARFFRFRVLCAGSSSESSPMGVLTQAAPTSLPTFFERTSSKCAARR